MKAEELRIGNLLLLKTKLTRTIKVENVGIEGINYEWNDMNQECYSFEFLHGIPLTPEILDKAGFEKNIKYNSRYIHKENSLIIEFLWYEQIGVYLYDVFLCNVEDVHQLQNLYYALTGKELTVNL